MIRFRASKLRTLDNAMVALQTMLEEATMLPRTKGAWRNRITAVGEAINDLLESAESGDTESGCFDVSELSDEQQAVVQAVIHALASKGSAPVIQPIPENDVPGDEGEQP